MTMRILGVIGIALLLAACAAGPLQKGPGTNAESGTASRPEIGEQMGGGGGGGM